MTSANTETNPEMNQSDTQSNTLAITPRTQIKRLPQRGNYDRSLIHQILDEGLICHIGFVVEGQPFVIPTTYGRVDDRLYLHGSPASRMLRTLKQSVELCVTVTLLDGLVLARSAFHHSMNYRSVVIFGKAEIVEDAAEKMAALEAFTEHILPGRWSEVRPTTHQEVAGTLVLSLPINEASAKVRTGPPKDEEADYALPIWAGELPLRLVALAPIPDPQLSVAVDVPNSMQQYGKGSVGTTK